MGSTGRADGTEIHRLNPASAKQIQVVDPLLAGPTLAFCDGGAEEKTVTSQRTTRASSIFLVYDSFADQFLHCASAGWGPRRGVISPTVFVWHRFIGVNLTLIFEFQITTPFPLINCVADITSMGRGIANLSVVLVCGVVLSCAREPSTISPLDIPPLENSADVLLKYAQAEFIRPAQLTATDENTAVGRRQQERIYQALKIQSSALRAQVMKVLKDNNEPYGLLIMSDGKPLNQSFCEALVDNLQFVSEELRSALVEFVPNAKFRDTYLFDKRSPEELAAIRRPSQLSNQDCAEFLPNLDYGLMHLMALRLGIPMETGGPWLVAIDPTNRWAIIFDFSKQTDDLAGALDQWTELLRDPKYWHEKEDGFINFMLQMLEQHPKMWSVRLPNDF
jgi:hypothetical protein